MSPRGKATLLSALLALAAVPALFSGGGKAASFVDPTAQVRGRVELGHEVFVAPFARLDGSKNPIAVGDEADVQDSVVVDAADGPITINGKAILAHGATVKGGTKIGVGGECYGGPGTQVCPSFVGFNAEVDGAIIEKNAMVGHLARVARGVTIPSGRKVKAGVNVKNDGEVAGKTEEVTKGDRDFMEEVVEVNVGFAQGYAKLAEESRDNVLGINYSTDRHLPTLDGEPQRAIPKFRNRIVGNIKINDKLQQLDRVMDSEVSLRADEGQPFEVDSIEHISENATFHALVHSQLHLGAKGKYGFHSLVHGGEVPMDKADASATATGNNVTLGAYSVFFRSTIGDNSVIGEKSLVQDSRLPANTIVPPREIWVNGKFERKVEW
jgi:carbonic anhydrase/acetyltransferase-like protein (isoleucine patch superfamily)